MAMLFSIFQPLWSFGDSYFSVAFQDKENFIENMDKAIFYYELAYPLSNDDWDKSTLMKNIADSQFFICGFKKRQGLSAITIQSLLESTFKNYEEASRMALMSASLPSTKLQNDGWFRRLAQRQDIVADVLWNLYESSIEDFNVLRSRLEGICRTLNGFFRAKYFLQLGLVFLQKAKSLKKKKMIDESLRLLLENKFNIEESKKQVSFVQQAVALENRNDFKIYNLQVKGQYNEKELKERFLAPFREELENDLDALKKASAESTQALIDVIYSQYPPKRQLGSALLGSNVSSMLKKALVNYREDKQNPKIDGWKWMVLTGEITRELNRHKSIQ